MTTNTYSPAGSTPASISQLQPLWLRWGGAIVALTASSPSASTAYGPRQAHSSSASGSSGSPLSHASMVKPPVVLVAKSPPAMATRSGESISMTSAVSVPHSAEKAKPRQPVSSKV